MIVAPQPYPRANHSTTPIMCCKLAGLEAVVYTSPNALRITFYVLRFTFYVSRFTHPGWRILRRVDILGVGVHDCDQEEAVRAIEGFLREEPPRLRQVATVNPEFVMEARRNPAFRGVLNEADLATPDGVGILLAARLLGAPLRGRATGVALVDRLAGLSARQGYKLYFLGAGPGVAEEAATEMARRHPGVRIAGTYPGSPRDSDWPAILKGIEAAQPNVLLVA